MITTGLAACRKNNDASVFSQTPDERLNAVLSADSAILVSAPYGWRATIIPDSTMTDSAYYCWFRFTDSNRVISRMNAKPALASSYRLKALQQPELIFDTYTYLHDLANPDALVPGATSGHGLYADFEFEMRQTTADSLVLIGKYNGMPVNFYKATDKDSANTAALWLATRNPFVGVYAASGTITLFATTIAAGTIAAVRNISSFVSAPRLSLNSISLPYADLFPWQYKITIDLATNQVTSVVPDENMTDGIMPGSFKLLDVTLDATLKKFFLKSQYTNTAGNERIVEETFTMLQ